MTREETRELVVSHLALCFDPDRDLPNDCPLDDIALAFDAGEWGWILKELFPEYIEFKDPWHLEWTLREPVGSGLTNARVLGDLIDLVQRIRSSD